MHKQTHAFHTKWILIHVIECDTSTECQDKFIFMLSSFWIAKIKIVHIINSNGCWILWNVQQPFELHNSIHMQSVWIHTSIQFMHSNGSSPIRAMIFCFCSPPFFAPRIYDDFFFFWFVLLPFLWLVQYGICVRVVSFFRQIYLLIFKCRAILNLQAFMNNCIKFKLR